ncbi:MAG TPA: hypothetical protein VMU90_06415 [Solirubrobacteraceae bacterium]|nr:hypothetical protein [Solirubrobacteraceae bacterium]
MCSCGRTAVLDAPGFEWLADDRIAQSLQQTLRDLDVAYQRFLTGEARRPRFKVKGRGESFRLPQGVRGRGITREPSAVLLHGLRTCGAR